MWIVCDDLGFVQHRDKVNCPVLHALQEEWQGVQKHGASSDCKFRLESATKWSSKVCVPVLWVRYKQIMIVILIRKKLILDC